MRRLTGLLALTLAACSSSKMIHVHADGPGGADTFRVAALHLKSNNGRRGSAAEAHAVLTTNFERTAPLIRAAARDGAKVIVTPEYSNTGIQIALSARRHVSTTLPDAPTRKPLFDIEDPTILEPVRRFARLSAEVGAYVVTDYLERTGEGDEVRYYNTMVVFDPDGRLLAKYRKINLYMFENLIEDRGSEVVSFDTPYGRFGMLLCFDAVSPWTWRRLVDEHDVDFLIAQTLWEPTPIFSGRQAMSLLARLTGCPVVWANQRRLLLAGGAGIVRPRAPDTALSTFDPAGVAVANLPVPERLRLAACIPDPARAVAAKR